MGQKALILGGVALAAALVFAQGAQAADSCTKNFTQAVGQGNDLKAASLLLEKAGNCCSTDLGTGEVQSLIKDIKSLVATSNAAVAKGGDKADAGKIMSIALDCAGQPSLVAADPTLFSTVLADSAQVVELAQDETGKDGVGNLPQIINLVSNPNSFRTPNNQQPTVSVEQK